MQLNDTQVERIAALRGALLGTTPVVTLTVSDDAAGSSSAGGAEAAGRLDLSGCAIDEFSPRVHAGGVPRSVRIDDGLTVVVGATLSEGAERGREPLPAASDVAGRQNVVRGRVALVTGGAQGFGEELVRRLVGAGALVFIADLNRDGAAHLSAALNAEYGPVTAPLAVDVSDDASVATMLHDAIAAAGGVDLVISNAGVLKAGSVKELSAKDFDFVTRVNYTGMFLCAKHASRVMAAQNATAPTDRLTDIVQINSKSGLEGSNKNGAYAGSKFGGIGLVQSFALELVTDRIKVNAICPGNFLDGPLWSDPDRGLFVQYLQAGKVPGATTIADVRAFYEAKVPLGRGCTGDDVFRALLYVVEQQYETGQAVPVTGGQNMLS